MIIQENIKILMINDDPYYKETTYQNRNGKNIIIPARSVMFNDYDDMDGYPVYEFASLDYITPEVVDQDRQVYNLIANPNLEEKIQNRKETCSETQSRVAHISIKYRDSVTGEIFPYAYDEVILQERLSSSKMRYEWGIAEHTCDLYQPKDEADEIEKLRKEYRKTHSSDDSGLDDYIKLYQKIFAGNNKPRHIHALVRKEEKGADGKRKKMRLSSLARELGIPEFCIMKVYDNSDKSRGTDGFLDGIAYLTHNTSAAINDGKYIYPDSIVTASFDWIEALEAKQKQVEKYGHELNHKEEIRARVLYEGLTLSELQKEDPIAYMRDIDKLKKLRSEYINNTAPMPPFRLNIYVDGKGGIGKNTCSKAIAHALYPDLDSEDCYFEVGGDNVNFDGYDGQPVIIWNDYRAIDLVLKFGRGEVFDIFDIHPTSSKHNIKYGSIKMINAVNIVNGIEPFREFLDSLAGEYRDRRTGEQRHSEDKTQSYRRFPLILPIREDDYDIYLNKGFMEGTREYLEFITYQHIRGSFAKIARNLEGKCKEVATIRITAPILEATKMIGEVETKKVNEILPSEFEEYGTGSILGQTHHKEEYIQTIIDQEWEDYEKKYTLMEKAMFPERPPKKLSFEEFAEEMKAALESAWEPELV